MDMYTTIFFQLQFRTHQHKHLKMCKKIRTEWGTPDMAITQPKRNQKHHTEILLNTSQNVEVESSADKPQVYVHILPLECMVNT